MKRLYKYRRFNNDKTERVRGIDSKLFVIPGLINSTCAYVNSRLSFYALKFLSALPPAPKFKRSLSEARLKPSKSVSLTGATTALSHLKAKSGMCGVAFPLCWCI